MKVLLILINQQFWYAVKRSFMIWISTGILGSVTVCLLAAGPPTIDAVWLSLLFSSPALVLAIPVLYYLPAIHHRTIRTFVAIFLVAAVSAFIIGITAWIFELPFEDVAVLLFPFIPIAMLCLFLLAGKQIVKRSTHKLTTQ